MLITHKFIVCTRIVAITCIVLIVLLTGFEWMPLSNYRTTYLNNANAQSVRSQVLVKSAMTLAYRPTSEHADALSDMQVALPLFIAEQTTLSGNHHGDIEQSSQFARSDYLAMVEASQNILDEAKANQPISTDQVDILIAHNKGYLITQNGIVAAIVTHQQLYQSDLFSIEIAFGILLILLLGGFLLRFEMSLHRYKRTIGH